MENVAINCRGQYIIKPWSYFTYWKNIGDWETRADLIIIQDFTGKLF